MTTTNNPQATNFEAEFNEFCKKAQQEEYQAFCQATNFQGGYEDYCEVMEVVREEIRDRAKEKTLERDIRRLKDMLLLPLIYKSGELNVSDEFADELISSLNQTDGQEVNVQRSGNEVPDESISSLSQTDGQGVYVERIGDAIFRYGINGELRGELRVVEWRGHKFYLTKLQGRGINALLQAQKEGSPGFSTEEFVKASKSNDTDGKIRSRLFRTNRAVIDSGFLMEQGRLWKLNLARERP